MCSYLFPKDSSFNEDMAEPSSVSSNPVEDDDDGTSSVAARGEDDDDTQSCNADDDSGSDKSVEERTDTDDDKGDILSVEAEGVIMDHSDIIDNMKDKIASVEMEIEKHRLRKDAVSYLREQFVNRLLSVADMKARWDNDEYFERWYDHAQDLMYKDPNLDLDTAMRITLKKHKEVLHKQLRVAMENNQSSSEETASESDEEDNFPS
jgi:hypothetical protein